MSALLIRHDEVLISSCPVLPLSLWERAGGEAGVSDGMPSACITVSACKRIRALQVRGSGSNIIRSGSIASPRSKFSCLWSVLLAASLIIAAPSVLAHGDSHKMHTGISSDEHAFGREGDPRHVTRTIVIEMQDSMRYSPSQIQVRQGDTIKFVVKNNGKTLHELVLGTMDELSAHGELMKKNPGMEHDEPYMAHVKPGAKGEMVWQFTNAGEFHYGCLMPGHFEAGMTGKITVIKG